MILHKNIKYLVIAKRLKSTIRFFAPSMSGVKKTKFEIAVIENVIRMRVANGLSQYDIATILGLTSGFVGQIESPTHTSKYNLNHLNKLAHAMKCSVKDFIPEKPIPEGNWDD